MPSRPSPVTAHPAGNPNDGRRQRGRNQCAGGRPARRRSGTDGLREGARRRGRRITHPHPPRRGTAAGLDAGVPHRPRAAGRDDPAVLAVRRPTGRAHLPDRRAEGARGPGRIRPGARPAASGGPRRCRRPAFEASLGAHSGAEAPGSNAVISLAFYIHCCDYMDQVGRRLGRTERAVHYAQLARTLRKAFIANHWDASQFSPADPTAPTAAPCRVGALGTVRGLARPDGVPPRCLTGTPHRGRPASRGRVSRSLRCSRCPVRYAARARTAARAMRVQTAPQPTWT
ncbi:hypothetical protein M2158_004949 [Streptomyces sp. SAI-144]|nr:hypothetical protein [Streptomyces sp. SAI-144]